MEHPSRVWKKFCDYIKNENRFCLNAENRKFITFIRKTLKNHTGELEKGRKLCRARIGYCEPYEPYSDDEINAPPEDKTKNSRLSPQGISLLYLSNELETAISEVRPWIGSTISIGVFKLKKRLKCIGLMEKPNPFLPPAGIDKTSDDFQPPADKNKTSNDDDFQEQYIWNEINRIFSRPVSPYDEQQEYIPTQYLAAFFKERGYEGIIYRSAMKAGGFNICVFDKKNVSYERSFLYQIDSLKYYYTNITNNCFVTSKKKGAAITDH